MDFYIRLKSQNGPILFIWLTRELGFDGFLYMEGAQLTLWADWNMGAMTDCI